MRRAAQRDRAGVLLRYPDRIRDDLRHCGIPMEGAETAAKDRAQWRLQVRSGAAVEEEK